MTFIDPTEPLVRTSLRTPDGYTSARHFSETACAGCGRVTRRFTSSVYCSDCRSTADETRGEDLLLDGYKEDAPWTT